MDTVKTCRLCSKEKNESEFNPKSHQCKRCLADKCLARYYATGQKERMARRRVGDFARKHHEPIFSPTERAYAAGLVDGEGCIGVNRRTGHGGVWGQRFLGVWVTNTSKPMIDYLQSRWGGSVRHVPAQPEKNRRPQWFWMLSCNKALYFLDDIYDFLIVKRRQGQLGRRFQRYVQVTGRERTEKIARVQDRFYQEFKILNKRGLA